MRLEDLKYDLPETPDFIHQRIQEEVARQLQSFDEAARSGKRKIRWSALRVAAAAVACLAGTVTVAYAGNQFYQMYLEKQGTYQVGIGIESQKDVSLPAQVHDITLRADYTPPGLEWDDQEWKLNSAERPNQGGISISSVLMDCSELDSVMVAQDVVESEKLTFGDYEGVYVRYHDLQQNYSFNQRIYMMCPDVYWVLIIYIGDDVSKEDALKFAENLHIVETEELIKTAGLYTWSDEVHPEEPGEKQVVTEAKIPVHQIGEAFSMSSNSSEEEEALSVTVNSVQIADNLQLLDGKEIPEEWADAVDADGKLVPNHISYVKSGDGAETLDEVVKEEDVAQKLVHATVTYTNMTEQEMTHVLYLGTLMKLKQNGDIYTVCGIDEASGNGYDRFYGDGAAKTGSMVYCSLKEMYGDGGNYIPSLKPGESVQIEMAWIVNETDLEDLYLNLNGSGACYDFDEAVQRTGVVDIGK